MRKTIAVILPAICLSLILTMPLSCHAKSLSPNDVPQETEETGGNDMQTKESPEIKENPETKESSENPDNLKTSLEDFFKTLLETMTQYRNQDIEFGTDLMEIMDEINQTLTSLYDEIKTKNEFDAQVSEYLLSEESGTENLKPDGTEPETETEAEPETKFQEELEELMKTETVSSANLDDIDGNLLLIIDELRISNENDVVLSQNIKSLLSGIILAVTIGTGFIAGLIALRRFR